MENNDSKVWQIVVAVLAIAGIAYIILKTPNDAPVPTSTDGMSQEVPNNPLENPNVNAMQLCYIWNTEGGDKALLSMDIRDTAVIGEFNWLPAEKDRKTGTFEGTVTGPDASGKSMVNALWKSSGEGMTNTEELIVKFDTSIAGVGFGEMVQGTDGVWRYADKTNISYVPNLQRTDCGDSAMD